MSIVSLVIALGAGALPLEAGATEVVDAGSPQPEVFAQTEGGAGDAGAPAVAPPVAPVAAPLFTSARGEVTALVSLGVEAAPLGLLAAHGELMKSIAPSAWVRASLAVELKLYRLVPVYPYTSAAPSVLSLVDDGSSIAAGFAPSGSVEKGALALELFPLRGDRVRPFFDWADAWGLPLRGSTNPEPVARLSWEQPQVSIWAAVRLASAPPITASTLTGRIGVSVFGGARLPLPRGFAAEVRGGRFDRGWLAALDGRALPSVAVGGSARLSWETGCGVGPAWDASTYASDPERFERFFEPEPTEPFGAWVGLEGGYATQNLLSAEGPVQERQQPAGYADLQARLRVGRVRLFGTFRLRTPSLVLFDRPGFLDARSDFGAGAVLEPEVGGILGLDVRVGSTGLVLGALLRLRRPASVVLPVLSWGDNNPPPGVGPGRWVVYDAARIVPLGETQWVDPAFGAQLSVRYELARLLVLLGTLDSLTNPHAGASLVGSVLLQAKF